MVREKVQKESRYHLVRYQNPSFSFKSSIRIAAILISFLFIVLVFALIGKFSYGETMGYMFTGAFGNNVNTAQTFLSMMMLLILALGLAPAYKMHYWNTGALGQALIGNIFSSLIVFYAGAYITNNFWLLFLALISALIGGAIWGLIPGIFKAKIKANETLFTLMMNYVAIQLVLIMIEVYKGGDQDLKPFKYGAFDTLFGSQYGWVYLITVLLALFVYVYLKHTKHGYELAVLGESYNTAKYAGINTSKVIMRTAALSGALCAICGFVFTATNLKISTSSDGGYGFTSIIVTWSSHFSILAMAVVAFLIGFLQKGSDGVRNKASDSMNSYAGYIAVGIFLFFLIGCEFFLNYKLIPNSKLAKKQEEKREEFAKKHPLFVARWSVFWLKIHNFFAIIGKFIDKIAAKISGFFSFVVSQIFRFNRFIWNKSKALFSKKGGNQ